MAKKEMSNIAVMANSIENFTGITNFLRRIGAGFSCSTKVENLLNENFSIFFIIGNFTFNAIQKERIKKWSKKGGRLILCGHSNLAEEIFKTSILQKKLYNPYWFFSIDFAQKKTLISFPNYPCLYLEEIHRGVLKEYPLDEVKGYFLKPAYAKFERDNNCYFVYYVDTYLLLSVPVFQILGDIFLGEIWIENLKDWYSPFFWIDEYCSVIKKVIEDIIGRKIVERPTSIVKEGCNGIIVLRHDVDSSTDTTYLEYEINNNIPATYCILLDKNRDFWLSHLKEKNNIEISYHYNTYIKKGLQCEPLLREITGRGLYAQYLIAKHAKIYSQTINRHGPFLVLPEFYYALEYLCEKEPSILGGGSLFRGIILKVGADRPDNMYGYIGKFPETIMPFWYPIKPFLKIKGKIKAARFWESTSVMETDPPIIDEILNGRDNLLGNKSIYTFNFHPAHVNKPTFNKDGCLPWFKYLINKAKRLNFEFLTLAQTYERMNKWEERNVRYYLD